MRHAYHERSSPESLRHRKVRGRDVLLADEGGLADENRQDTISLCEIYEVTEVLLLPFKGSFAHSPIVVGALHFFGMVSVFHYSLRPLVQNETYRIPEAPTELTVSCK